MANDVDYYNKDITKKQQRNNKVSNDLSSFSSGLASLSASPLGSQEVNPEVLVAPAEPPSGGIETLPSDFGQQTIKSENVKRAVVQLWHNAGELREWKLKVRLNLDFGEGEEAVDFICPLTKDWGNFTKYHPAASKSDMVEWARGQRKELKSAGFNPYLGKFHNNTGWNPDKQRYNQKEPWTSALVWYDKEKTTWYASVRIYGWEEVLELPKQGLNEKQAKCKGQKIWMNPLHYTIERPLTWAQKRFGK